VAVQLTVVLPSANGVPACGVHETMTGGMPPLSDGLAYGTVLMLVPVTGSVILPGQEISGGPKPAGGGGGVG
jgi:hypothetical protein